MLVARCPQCGSPNPVHVATPHAYACGSCRYEGQPSPDVVQRLEEAGRVLFSLDARGRQLGGRQRRLIESARRAPWMLAALLVSGLLLLLPCVGCGLLFGITPYPSYSLALICASPPLVLGAIGFGLVLISFRRRRSLERACAAIPPDVEGAAARCHVCGGPLPPGALSRRGIVRCGYCHADNLVDPGQLAGMGSKRTADIAGFERELRKHGLALKTESTLALIGMVLLVFGSPTSCCCTATVVYKWVPRIEVPAHEDLEYLLVDTSAGVCVARVHLRYADGTAYLIGASHLRDVRSTNYVPGAAPVAPLRADWLVGHDVTVNLSPSRSLEGRVVRVHGNPLEPRETLLVLEPRPAVDPRIETVCLRERPTGVTIVPWPETSRTPGHSLPDGTRHDDPRIAR